MKIKYVKAEAVSKTYRGRPGCMCGCKGLYHSKPRLMYNLVRDMNSASENGLGEIKWCKSARAFYLETERHNLVAYVDRD